VVLIAVVMKSFVIMLCSPMQVNRNFEEKCSDSYLLLAGFFLDLFFDLKDGCDLFLRNVIDFQQTTRHYIPLLMSVTEWDKCCLIYT
jgi:hypothetical protein